MCWRTGLSASSGLQADYTWFHSSDWVQVCTMNPLFLLSAATWDMSSWWMEHGCTSQKNTSSFKTSSFFKTINILRPHTSHLAKPNIKWTEKHTLSILIYCKEKGWRIKNHPVYQSVCGSTHQQSLGSCFWVPWREGVSALWHRDSSSSIG